MLGLDCRLLSRPANLRGARHPALLLLRRISSSSSIHIIPLLFTSTFTLSPPRSHFIHLPNPLLPISSYFVLSYPIAFHPMTNLRRPISLS